MDFPRRVQIVLLVLTNGSLALGNITLWTLAEVSSSSTSATTTRTRPSMAIRVLLPIISFCSLVSLVMISIMSTSWYYQKGQSKRALEQRERTNREQQPKGQKQEQEEEQQYPNVSTVSIWFIFPASISLCVILCLRLIVGQDHFHGNASQLDFGPKHGLVGEDNKAFAGHSFNTYGHCLQGFLASLLQFPTTIMALTSIILSSLSLSPSNHTDGRCCGNCRLPDFSDDETIHTAHRSLGTPQHYLISIISSFMLLYPIYNCIKRWYKDGETFAASSFANNATEWCLGFLVGLAIGLLCYTIIEFTRGLKICHDNAGFVDHYLDEEKEEENVTTNIGNNNNHNINGQGDVDDLASNSSNTCTASLLSQLALRLQQLFGSLVLFTTFCSAVLFGLSWNSCKSEDDTTKQDCLNYSNNGEPNMKILFGFLLVPVFVYAVVIVLSKRFSVRELSN